MKKILLVDDSATARMMSRMILGSTANYELVSACDGQEGVEKALREKPDLILMDVVMPRLSGFQACALLRKEEQTKRTPIILLTTRGEEQWVQKGFESGCNDYLTKPFNESELVALLKNYLGE